MTYRDEHKVAGEKCDRGALEVRMPGRNLKGELFQYRYIYSIENS